MGAAYITPPATVSTANPEWKPTGEAASDLQGFIASAYPHQLFAMSVMLKFTASSGKTANAWIGQLADRITDSTGKRDTCINVALTAAGLREVGVPESVMATFSLPFEQGMTTENRSRFLGDKPDSWIWSDCADNPNCIHAQLLIFALDQSSLDSAVAAEVATLASFGVTVAGQLLLRVKLAPDNQRHEHFGFADGISQPILVDGKIPVEKRAIHEIPAGEVVLGQTNTYGVPAPGPFVPASPIAARTLTPAAVEGTFDLGLNGTYLVVRQLKQDVATFWNNMKAAAKDLLDENKQPATDEWLAQKAVGRTLSGDMLTPNGPIPGNNMTFYSTDQGGFGCPVTSHVRRANPRDGLAPSPEDKQDMINANNRHRIVRRGRIYGKPIENRYVDDGADRGLLFMCMNSDLQRQFEFVQHTWMLNPMFGMGFEENDPILGPNCPFSIPSIPVRQQPMIDTFVMPVGGGYFFLPSIRSLRYLGAMQ